MKSLRSIKMLSTAACISLAGLLQQANAATLNLEIKNFQKVGNTLQFNLYMGIGTGYPNSNTVRGFKSSNIRMELQGVGGGTLNISGATVTNINNGYVDQVSVSPAPAVDEFSGTTDRFSVQVARNIGSPAQADLPAVPVMVATITLPIATGTYDEYLTTLKSRTATSGNGSFWNDLTNVAQPFNQTVSPVPLPVALLGFEARKDGPSQVKINWATASEKQAAFFEIERSTDGKSYDNLVARIAAKGISTTERHYETLDLHPVKGVNYYRLKLINQDESRQYSAVRQVYFDGMAAGVAVFPSNNTTGMLYADMPTGYEQANLQLFNELGQLVSATFTTDGLHRSVNLNSLAAGNYLVAVELKGNRQLFKVTYRP